MPKSMTVAAAEDTLRKLDIAPPTVFRIPTKGKHHQAGGEAAMTQALISWARSKPPGEARLQTYIDDAENPEGQIRTLTRQFFGLSAALIGDFALDRFGVDRVGLLRASGLERLEIIQGERPRSASRGPQYEIVCADHLGRSAPSSLYETTLQGEAKVRGGHAFDQLAKQITKTLVPENLASSLPPTFSDTIGATLYELFRNTDEHARVDEQDNRLTRSIRAIQARRHDITPSALAEIVAASPPLANYARRLSPPRASNSHIQLLELSVLDSGPGLAAAIAKSKGATVGPGPMSRSDEHALLLECFRKHASSKQHSNAGLGLSNVVDILRRNNGFLRVRSGRQALYADLGLEQGESFETPPQLSYWQPDQENTPPAVGTLITFLIPLSHEGVR